ncbi:hypothetical protein KKB43_01725 [Patescibacteria group bacterium]|nr:hypothetical protein [Patescibacteria group bacterium]MCG2691114.1 hypothetical protein [Candidatus Parcubacteria bacterium]
MNLKVKRIIIIIIVIALFFGTWKFFSYYNSYGTAVSTARDAKRVEDFQNLRLSLMLYFTEHNAYPQNLNGLLPRYLSEISQDPREGENHKNSACESAIGKNTFSYRYELAESGKKFTLTACLENGKILTISP